MNKFFRELLPIPSKPKLKPTIQGFTVNPLPDDIFPIIAVVGLAVGVLAIGLFVGFFLSNRNSSPARSTSGYSIERDDRGRILGIIPLPFPSMNDLVG